jgi:hypothetical protein
MTKLINRLLAWFGQLHRVEFDYHDAAGKHHGRCYVRYAIAGQHRVRRQMSRYGYTNIRID